MRYMLDTNTASYVIKDNDAVRKHLLKVPMHEVCISVITEAELLFGAAKNSSNAGLQTAVREFLLRLDILPWATEAARKYALLRAQLESHGKVMGNMDLLIAAHALAVNCTLVTNDRAFGHINELRLANWMR